MTVKHSFGDVLFAVAVVGGCWVLIVSTVHLFAQVIR
jgi:hypothetical protein